MNDSELTGTTRTLRVRPYALTGGRTRSATDLPLETIVKTTQHGSTQIERMSLERRDIASLCVQPMAIAEISAHLKVPLGVARVLVGDMVTEGVLVSHTGAAASTAPGGGPDVPLLERVLNGLQSL